MSKMSFIRKIPDNSRPWQCVVNEREYVYPAGTTQDVPEEVAHIIDAYWKSMEPVKGGSGDAGAGMLVTVTQDEDYNYIPDKNFEDVWAAIDSGADVRFVIVELDGGVTHKVFLNKIVTSYEQDDGYKNIKIHDCWTHFEYIWDKDIFVFNSSAPV